MKKRKIAVVGGGIIGASVAAHLSLGSEKNSVTVYEKEKTAGEHQTGHNSGVVHAGLYYTPGSLKAKLTRRGTDLLKAFTRQHGIAYEECGKLVIANSVQELSRLEGIFNTAKANGVPGVQIIDEDGIKEKEPLAVGKSALFSPETAIIDYPGVTKKLINLAQKSGGEVRFEDEVRSVRKNLTQHVVESTNGEESYDYVIVCGGLQADRLARKAGGAKYPAIVPFSGNYYQLTDAKSDTVTRLIYPVPDPNYPFLGVHLTPTVDRTVTVGPNAFLSFAREKYGRIGFNIKDSLDIAGDLAFWRFASGNMGEALQQIRSIPKSQFVRGAQAFIPQLKSEDFVRGPKGIRAQAMNKDGSLVDDFVIERFENVVFIRNAPSPAATSSLAIAEHIVTQILSEDRLVDGPGETVLTREENV